MICIDCAVENFVVGKKNLLFRDEIKNTHAFLKDIEINNSGLVRVSISFVVNSGDCGIILDILFVSDVYEINKTKEYDSIDSIDVNLQMDKFSFLNNSMKMKFDVNYIVKLVARDNNI